MVFPVAALIAAGASIAGGAIASRSTANAAEQNTAMQKEFAQNGIQWKVEDAKKAGIHPLAALGAQTISYSPSYVGDSSFGTGIANAGQDISRAIDATRTSGARAAGFEKTVQDLTVQKMGLENQILASQLATINQAGHPPARPGDAVVIDGQGNSKVLKMGGADIVPDPRWSDAQDVVNRYGEPAEWLYAPMVSGADAARNMPTLRDLYYEMRAQSQNHR